MHDKTSVHYLWDIRHDYPGILTNELQSCHLAIGYEYPSHVPVLLLDKLVMLSGNRFAEVRWPNMCGAGTLVGLAMTIF